MISEIKKLARRCYNSTAVRYVIVGGLTTLVNLLAFYIFRSLLSLPLTIANIISISLAILFSYVMNAAFVFHSKRDTVTERLREMLCFVGGRLLTMVIEVGGVWFFVEALGMNEMFSKLLTQVVVIVLNYVISRFLVFIKK